MKDLVAELTRIEQGIRQLEEHHNDVLDVSEATRTNIGVFAQEVHQESTRIHQSTAQLREAIHKRIAQAKRATVIMSLLAQQEELTPLKNRIDKQPYEFYATSEWFKKKLSELP